MFVHFFCFFDKRTVNHDFVSFQQASGFVSLNSVPKSSLLGKEALFDYQPGLATGDYRP